MVYPKIATLGGTNLPPQFSYEPYIPVKRQADHQTHGAVITQYPPNQIIHGDEFVRWNCPGAYPTEFETLWDLYNTITPVSYSFVGYWGEQLNVFFTIFNPPRVRGRLFNLSGQFQVTSVVADYDPLCNAVS
jgi:hypothetical protein